MMSAGLHEHLIMNAVCSYILDGVVGPLVATHVDDLIWAATERCDDIFNEVRRHLTFGTEEERNFRFCGIEIAQQDDYGIKVTCEQSTKRLGVIRLSAERRIQVSEPATTKET